MRIHRQSLFSKIFCGLAYCLVVISAEAGEITYTGSSAIGRFIESASQVYKESTFRINTLPESSGGEICAYRSKCDIGGVARFVNDRYLDKGVVATLIGFDAIAAIVHKNNYVSELTSCQLSGIFSGAITNWSEVGGSDRKIKVNIPSEISGTYKVFKQAVLRHKEYVDVKKVSPDPQIITNVAENAGAIGQISIALIGNEKDVKTLVIDGESCSIENQTYPITRPLYLLTMDSPKGEVKSFIDWVLTPAGQEEVKKYFIGHDAARLTES